jgi:hypothetical protein
MSITNPPRTEMGSDPVLRGKNPATKSLSHDTALALDLKIATRQVVAAAEIMMMMMMMMMTL